MAITGQTRGTSAPEISFLSPGPVLQVHLTKVAPPLWWMFQKETFSPVYWLERAQPISLDPIALWGGSVMHRPVTNRDILSVHDRSINSPNYILHSVKESQKGIEVTKRNVP